MTPPMATEEKPKRKPPEVWAKPCPECGSERTRVHGQRNGGRKRYCKCDRCGATWAQTPNG